MKIKSEKEGLIKLNERFHNKDLLGASFYNQMEQAGIEYNRSILIIIFPDGDNTYCGQVIRQDGEVFEFDLCLDDAKFSSWVDITDEFREIYKNNIKRKPWLREIVSKELFNEL